MQIIEQKKQATELSDVDVFKNNIYGMFNQLKILHTSLMKVWDKPNAEEILRGVGIDAKELFNQSYGIQMILKTADPSYEFITPYRLQEIETPVLDENEEPKIDSEGNPMVKKSIQKIALEVSFNEDGSILQIIEK